MSKLIKAGWIISLIFSGFMTGSLSKSRQVKAEMDEAIYEVPSGGEIKLLDLEDHNENRFVSLSFNYTVLDQVEFVFRSSNARLTYNSVDYIRKSVSVNFELLTASVEVELGVKSQTVSLVRQIYFEMASDSSYAISAVSRDQAQIRLLNYEYSIGMISEEEKIDSTKEILSQSVQETISQTPVSGQTVKINGHFTWTDDYGSTHTFRDTKVEIVKKIYSASSMLLSENVIFSDAINWLGELSINDTLNLANGSTATYLVRTHAGGTNTKVVDGNFQEFVHESQPITLKTGAIINLNQNFTMATDLGRAMQIGQAVTFYDLETRHIDYKQMASCTVVYSEARTAYSRGLIYLQAVTNPVTSNLPSSYANWDVIGHEYAHHIQVSLGFANSFGGMHMANVSMADYYLSLGYGEFEAKYLGSRLAWSEGWATYFAISMQRLAFAELSSVKFFDDDLYTAYNGVVIDLRSRADLKGETCENTISAFLYRIIETYDMMNSWLGDWDWPMEDLWNLVTRNKIGSLSEMFNLYYPHEGQNQDMARILEEFGLTALNLQVKSGNTLSVPPTISWSKSDLPSSFLPDDFELTILDGNKQEIMTISTRAVMSYTLTAAQWKTVKDAPGIHYLVYVTSRSLKGFETGPYCTSFLEIEKPAELVLKTTIRPADYGFAQQYYNDVQPTVSHKIGDLSFKTTRLRTGYIEKEYVVMSPIKTGAGEAYIKYEFDRPVYKVQVDMAMWREDEYKDKYLSIYFIYENKEGYNEYFYIWADDLPINRKTPKTFSFSIPEGATKFQFQSRGPATGSDNKGRICIGNMQVSSRKEFNYLPLSGSEIDYDPSVWSGEVSYNNNCYNYALNNQVVPGTNELWYKQQPGEYSGNMYYDIEASEILRGVRDDFAEYNRVFGTKLVFQPVGRYDICPAGTYKVALVIAPGWDYHWFRQDSDGYWSHKPGTTPVKRTDESNKLIIDPMTADRGYYTEFVGYYAVTGWNNFYSA